MWDRLSKKGKDCRKNHSVRDRGGNVLLIAETGEDRLFVQGGDGPRLLRETGRWEIPAGDISRG
ncbi:MAG: hypothetical protein CMJ75_02450 [Planctomycetaceae bacterium]|nr:hypothetical protein [Planctomycetaceae bacterium]